MTCTDSRIEVKESGHELASMQARKGEDTKVSCEGQTVRARHRAQGYSEGQLASRTTARPGIGQVNTGFCKIEKSLIFSPNVSTKNSISLFLLL